MKTKYKNPLPGFYIDVDKRKHSYVIGGLGGALMGVSSSISVQK